MTGAIKLEKLGVPGVFIVYDQFVKDAKASAQSFGMPSLRMVKVPGVWYTARRSIETMRPAVEAVFDEMVNALSQPLTEAEMKPKTSEKEALPPIKVSGKTYGEVLEKFNALFLENQWGDGLPLLPPTRERVNWILKGTNRSPKEVLGKIATKYGLATVEKVAINAVMAGAKPEYLPVIISAVEAISDEKFDTRHVLQSAGGFTFAIVVTGPIAQEIGMASGIGYLGHGWRPNNTIGRAIRLATLNIGHQWPTLNDMSATGRPSPHTFWTFAENSGDSPWPPYHVTQGFKPEDSCITVMVVGTYYGVGAGTVGYGGGIGTWNATQIFENIVKDLLKDREQFRNWDKNVGPLPGSGQGARKHLIVLFPELTTQFYKMGYIDQKSFINAIYERAVVPYEELTQEEVRAIERAIQLKIVPPEQSQRFKDALRPGGKVPVLISSDDIVVFVAGSSPGVAWGASYFRIPPYNYIALSTKKITGATLTKAGK